MEANPNAYSIEPHMSRDIVTLMRAINKLQRYAPTTPVYLSKFGSYGPADGQFRQCDQVAYYNYELYITDWILGRVCVHLVDGSFVRKWGSVGTGNGQYQQPDDICVYGDEVYIADQGNNRIQVTSTSGAYARKWGTVGTGDGQFRSPGGVCVYEDEVYVADTNNYRVQVFDLNGTFMRKFGSYGFDSGQFGNPPGIVRCYQSEVYVLEDAANSTLHVFDTSGNFRGNRSVPNARDGLAVQLGRVFLSCPYNNNIEEYTLDLTRKIQTWGTTGMGNGQFRLPYGLFVRENGRIWTTELYRDGSYSGNCRVQRFSCGLTQTEWTAYKRDGTTVSLGTPDAGISIPALDALDLTAINAQMEPNHIIDMRTAIEALAPYYGYNWTDGSASNLYYVAMGNRTKYGATGGARYDWTRTRAEMLLTPIYDIDIGEIYECVETMQTVAGL